MDLDCGNSEGTPGQKICRAGGGWQGAGKKKSGDFSADSALRTIRRSVGKAPRPGVAAQPLLQRASQGRGESKIYFDVKAGVKKVRSKRMTDDFDFSAFRETYPRNSGKTQVREGGTRNRGRPREKVSDPKACWNQIRPSTFHYLGSRRNGRRKGWVAS